jgi:hypothetical protein
LENGRTISRRAFNFVAFDFVSVMTALLQDFLSIDGASSWRAGPGISLLHTVARHLSGSRHGAGHDRDLWCDFFSVAERTREIGIRMALGAGRGDVLKLVLRRAMLLIGVGVTLGLCGSLALTRLIASQLWGITATDPVKFIVVTLLLILVAFTATFVPTRRAVQVDPTFALRYE